MAEDRPQPIRSSGQRRYVTLLFSDVSGSSEHAERLEAEEYSELLAQFRRFAHEIVPAHGGTIARMQGDGLLALFGDGEMHEDDARRATDAAMKLHAAVSTLRAGRGAQATALQLHSGIHAGLVLLIEGDIERGRVDVIGEVPNTAARLCSLAAAGEILASADALGPQAHFFETTPRRRLAIRGRSAPLNVLRIDGPARVERRIDAAARRGVLPFIGREATLATLADAAEQARAGTPAALMVSGEAGVGKTRIVEEFARRLDRERFYLLRGYCESYLGAEPLQPFMQALRGAMGWRAGDSAAHNEAAADAALDALGPERKAQFAPMVHTLLGARADAVAAPPRISALVDLLALLAGERTLVLVLDDWQWADDASRHALETLRARKLPLFVLVAARPFDADDHALVGARTLRLDPLDDAESEHAIGGWLPDADAFVVQAICKLSGGSPLFIEELCHAAASGARDWAAPRASGVAWLDALVASRFARLPPREAECLRVAAVAGHVFPAWLVEALDDAPDAAQGGARTLEALARSDFVIADAQAGMLRFKHLLTREAIYAMVEPEHRRALHRRIGELLEAQGGGELAADTLEALAYHFDSARDAPRSARYAEAAGDKALAAMSLDRARAQYITTLRALDEGPPQDRAGKLRWCAVAQKLGQTCVFDPLDVAQSFVLFGRAAQLARETGDANAQARAEYWQAYVNYGKGRPRQAVRHCEAALALAEASGDARLAAQCQATLGQALASGGQYERALPLFVQAVESKRAQSQPGNSTAIGSAYTLGRMAYTFGDLGRFDDAEAHFAESLHLLGDKVHSVAASVRELMAAVHLWQGRWDEADRAGQDGAGIALRCRSRYLTSMGQALAACGAWAGRRDVAALQTLRDATRWIELRGGAVSTSLNYGWLVEATLDLGLEAEARAQAARLFLRARTQDRHGEAQGCRALARWAAARGDAERTRRYLARAEDAATFRGSPREAALNLLARADIAARQGRAADARGLAESAGEAFERMKMAWHLDRARAILGEPATT